MRRKSTASCISSHRANSSPATLPRYASRVPMSTTYVPNWVKFPYLRRTLQADMARLRMWQRILSRARRLKAETLVLWFCCKHPGTPLAAKILATLVVAYALSPIDLIPDFIPVIGYLDDVILIPI